MSDPNSKGLNVAIFMVDGSPDGLRVAEIMNWTGHVLVGPRTQLPHALLREESQRTGVYLLAGESSQRPDEVMLYIGEADVISARIKDHSLKKDFWSRMCFVTSNRLLKFAAADKSQRI